MNVNVFCVGLCGSMALWCGWDHNLPGALFNLGAAVINAMVLVMERE